jgi:UDP-glucose 4-epimerase
MSVYGPHEEHKGRFANLVSQFIWGIEKGKRPVIYGDGNQTRDFTNVRDVVQAFHLAISTPRRLGFTVFNVGTSEAIKVRDIVTIINKILGSNVDPSYIENPIKSGYILSQQGDIAKIQQALGYAPQVSLHDGILEICEMRRRNPIQPASLSY